VGGEEALRAAYRAFNARDLDAALSMVHAEVDWPNAWEGGRVHGREAVREYWARQFAANLASRVEPERFETGPDGSIAVTVHQVVHGADGKLLSDSRVVHRWRFEDGLVVRMDVLEAADDQGGEDINSR
jgi:ketosteroid isomerase-like protein